MSACLLGLSSARSSLRDQPMLDVRVVAVCEIRVIEVRMFPDSAFA